MKKIDLLVILFIIIISLFSLKDLFRPGFYTSHDGINQVVRMYYFDQALKDGQIPPRWAGGLFHGFGYPLFNFSYHMPWFTAEIFHLFGFSIIESVKYTLLIGFIASGITMYFMQREIFGRLAGFVGMFIYLYAPYRFANIFVRSAGGEAISFVFLPLIFLGLWKLKYSQSRFWVIIGSIGVAGLVLSHAMIFFLFSFLMGFYVLFSLYFIKDKLRYILRSFILFSLGLCISAYYFIPSFIERNYTQFNEIMSIFFPSSYYLTLKDLIYSRWGYGVWLPIEGRMSFQIGITQWICAILTGAIILYNLLKKKRSLNTKEKQKVAEAAFFILMFIFLIFLMLPASAPIWKLTAKLLLVDFPWRLLTLIIFISSYLAGFIISKSGNMKLLLVIGLVILAAYSNRNHLKINLPLDWDVPFYLKLEKTTNQYDEYIPKWVMKERLEKPKPKIEFIQSKGSAKIQKNTSNYLEALLVVEKGGTVRINTMYYPGWEVEIDQRKVTFEYKNGGLIEFNLKKGTHKLVSRFKETPLRKASNALTIISLVTVSILLINNKKHINKLNI